MANQQKYVYMKVETKKKYNELSEEGKRLVNKAMRTYLSKVVNHVSEGEQDSTSQQSPQSLPSTDQPSLKDE